MKSDKNTLSANQKMLLALALLFHFTLLAWTVISFIPFCCESQFSSLKKGFVWWMIFTGWLATFPLSFFNATGKLFGIASFLLIFCITIMKFGFGFSALVPLLFLTIGFAVAMMN